MVIPPTVQMAAWGGVGRTRGPSEAPGAVEEGQGWVWGRRTWRSREDELFSGLAGGRKRGSEPQDNSRTEQIYSGSQ